MEIAEQKLIPTFTNLPLEIRLQIYKHVRHQIPHIRRSRKTPHIQLSPEFWLTTPIPNIGAAPFSSRKPKYHSTWNEEWDSDASKYGYSCFGALRATNRQLFHETVEFVRIPPLTMDITADYKVKDSMLDAVNQAREQQDIFKRDVVAVSLFYRCCDTGMRCRHRTSDKCVHEYPRRQKRTKLLRHLSARLLSCCKRPRAIQTSSFHAVIHAAAQFPQLQFLHVSFNHGDLLEWFAEPAAALAGFANLMKKERGVRVTMGIQVHRDRRIRWVWPCLEMAWALETGRARGPIVLRGREINWKALYFRGVEEGGIPLGDYGYG